MKKQKLTNLLKIGILIFGLSFFLTNCEKNDNHITENNTIEQNRKVSIVSYQELIQDTQISDFINDINTKSSKSRFSKNNSAKSANDCGGLEVINTRSSIVETKELSSKSYIPIKLIDPLPIKSSGKTSSKNKSTDNISQLNLVIEQENKVINDVYILKYTFTDRNTILINAFDIDGKEINYNTKIDNSAEGSIQCYTSIQWEVTYSQTPISGCQGSDCFFVSGFNSTITNVLTTCSGDGEGLQSYIEQELFLCNHNGSMPTGRGGSNTQFETNYDPNNIPEYICINADCSQTIKNIIPQEVLVPSNDLSLEIYDLLGVEIGNEQYNWNTAQKQFVNAILEDDNETAIEILLGNEQTINCCQFNPDCCDEVFDPMVQLTARIVIDARDGVTNLISAWVEHNLIISQNRKGKFVRNVMEQMGVDVPNDVDNETLAELFKVRQRNLDLVIEPIEDYLNEMLDIGISIIDVIAIVSPSKGAGTFIFAKTGTGTITAKALSSHLKTMANIAKTTLKGGKGYKSQRAFEKIHGKASPGNELHHIVEQKGFQQLNELKFGRTNIHNTKNIIDIPGKEAGTLHKKVTGHYNTKSFPFTNGKSVREWLSTKSFQEQYDYGIKILKEKGWDGITGIID